MHFRGVPTAMLVGVLLAAGATAQIWTEVGDASSYPDDEGQLTRGEGPLDVIVGSIGPFDRRDAYCLKIVDPETFAATTDPETDPSADADFATRLFLFRQDGAPVLANDDTSSGAPSGLSTLTGSATDGSGYVLTRPGQYVLVVSGEMDDPRDDANVASFLLTPADVVAAANPAAGCFDRWQVGNAATGDYSIGLAGVERCQTAIDVVIANNGANRACQGDDQGAFEWCRNVGAEAEFTRGVALGYVDGDGNLDAVFANYGTPNRICLGSRAGRFLPCTDVSDDTNISRDLALGYVDDDENLDAVFANSDANRVCFGDGAGGFSSCADIEAEEEFTRAVGLDFVNGDAYLDAVFANNTARNRVCLGNGSGAFSCSDVSDDTLNSGGLSFGHLDGDRHLDVVFSNSGPNRVCLGDGAGGFSSCSDANPGSGGVTWGVVLRKFDGDNILDAAFADYVSANEICLGDGTGTFSCSEVSDDINQTREVAAGLIDGDSTVDLVFANSEVNRVCLGDGAGGFSCSDVSADSSNSYDVALKEFGTSLIFADGFESGDTSAWSTTVP